MPLCELELKKLASLALKEDAAERDITTLSFIPSDVRSEARIIAKEQGVVAGLPIAKAVFRVFDQRVIFREVCKDGDSVRKGDVLAVINGPARSVLSCERVALNFLAYLSGIASETHKAVVRVKRKGIQILDTRKTTPLFRALEKYAVACGGGRNHRFDLASQYLVKDNHVLILKKTQTMEILSVRKRRIPFEIEVDSLDELSGALTFCPDIVLLDNFLPSGVRSALKIICKNFPSKDRRPLIELSGGITLSNIVQYAIKGVDFISLGALTHSARALDVSLEIEKVYI